VLSLAIEPKKLAKRLAARGPTSAISAGTMIGRPKGCAPPATDGRNTAGASAGKPGSAITSALDLRS
jgi:hypothetical protein